MLLIGICGKARVGKDTAANYLVTKYNLHKYSLADPIREMLAAIDVQYTDETKEKKHKIFDKSPREMSSEQLSARRICLALDRRCATDR